MLIFELLKRMKVVVQALVLMVVHWHVIEAALDRFVDIDVFNMYHAKDAYVDDTDRHVLLD